MAPNSTPFRNYKRVIIFIADFFNNFSKKTYIIILVLHFPL